MATVDELLIKLDATTEGLRREMTRAERSVSDMERKTDRHMKRFDKTIKDATAGAQRSMESLSARLGPVGALLSALGPAGLVAAAGIGSTVGVMAAATRTAQQFEQAGLKTAAILRATGHASGQTAESIRQMSREIALGTLASVQGVESAAQKLLTFRSVTGDTFRRTIELSQDLAAVGFGTVESAAVQLGKALEDPQQGLTAMRRIGVSFTESQREMITTLQQSGREMEAQGMILDAIQQQVGGAGVAEAGGLSGAVDTLGQRWEEFLEIVADRADSLGGATRGVNALAGAIDGLNNMLGPEADIAALDYWIKVRERMSLLSAPADVISQALGMGAPNAGSLQAMKDLRAELQRQLATETALAELSAERAEIEARAAQAERQRENALAGLNKQIVAGLSAEDKAAKKRDDALAQIDAWARHVGDVAEVEAARNAVLAEYDAAVSKAGASTDKATRRLAALKDQLDPVAAATRKFNADMRLLTQAGLGEGDLADQLVRRYGTDLTAAYEQVDGPAKTNQELDRQKEAGAAILADLERQTEQTRLLAAGQKEAAAWVQQEAEWREALGPMYDKMAPALRTAWEAQREVTQATEQQQAAMQYLENVGERAFDRIGSAITQAFTQGEGAAINFGSIAQGVLSELMQSFIELAAINPLKNALFGGSSPTMGSVGGIIGSIAGSLFGAGQTVYSVPAGPMPASFVGPMPAFASGGVHSGGLRLVGERGPEIEATGPSRIWSADQTAKMLGGGGGNVTVNVINNAGAEVSTQQRPDGNGGMQLDVMVDQAVAKKLGTQGSASNKALRANFGATPVLARR